MKKTIYRLAAFVIAASLLFGACGKSDAEESAGEEPAAETIEKTEILIGFDGDDVMGEELRKIADGFNSSQDLYEAVVSETAGERETDTASVIFMNDDAAAVYAYDTAHLDIRSYLDSDMKGSLHDIIGTLPENMYETVCDEEKGLFYLPVSVTAPVLYYNKTMYDSIGLELPKSYPNLRDNCLAVYARHRIPGYLPHDLAGDVLAMMDEQRQITEVQGDTGAQPDTAVQADATAQADTADQTGIAALTDADVLQLFAGSCEAGYFRMVQHETYAALDFSTGAVAAYAGTPSDYEMATENVTFDVGAVPWVMDSENAVYWVDTDGMVFIDQGEEKNKGAVAYAQYILGAQVCSEYLEVVGGISPYSSVYESQPYRKNRRGFDEITEAVSAEIPRADLMMISEEKRREIEELLVYIMDGKVTAEDAVTILLGE